ncbi:pilus assembly protein TadG-related protein [Agromyces italicus]|uniref:pilus assembly protein TadG-related protein n=1 Tax=Agromyces italicus TaxID=279572 RepID=UPI0003B60BFB|nr:TadE/TadG family type IV pilus assembly protein [Agromyces italicus]
MERMRRERGASAVLVAILLVPIFGMAAIGVDTGMLYYERAQLQNAADSAALAVATKCSVSHCPTNGDTTIASNFANGNSEDDAVAIDDQVIDRSARTVRIDVSTLNVDGTTSPFHPFAAVIGVTDNGPVTATATARWAAGDITIPLALSSCEFERGVGAAGAEDNDEHWVRFDRNKPCDRDNDPTEPDVPGGFGWLDPLLDDDGNPIGCLSEVNNDGTTAGSNTGNNGIDNEYGMLCHALFTESLVGQSLYVPIFDTKVSGSGQNAVVHLKHYAKVEIIAWMFGGTGTGLPNVWDNTNQDVDNLNCTGNCRAILLKFQEYVPVGSVPGTDISTTVSLIS